MNAMRTGVNYHSLNLLIKYLSTLLWPPPGAYTYALVRASP